jgi:hypothetical protein
MSQYKAKQLIVVRDDGRVDGPYEITDVSREVGEVLEGITITARPVNRIN